MAEVTTRYAMFEASGEAAKHPEGPRRSAAYMAWIGQRWAEWRAMKGFASRYQGQDVHAEFDAWLLSSIQNKAA